MSKTPSTTITITNTIKVSDLRKVAVKGGMKVDSNFEKIVTSPKFVKHIAGLMITTWDLANEDDVEVGEHLFDGFLEYK